MQDSNAVDVLTTGDGVTLCTEQHNAAHFINNFDGRAVILTGRAGSGKSAVIKALKHNFRNRFRLCATTGRAAMLIGGITVDTQFCFNREDCKVWSWDYLDKVMASAPDRIIIDEASMIGQGMANVLHRVAVQYRKTLVLVGDWGQCRPVKDEWPFDTVLFKEAQIVRLIENHRQSEEKFVAALNDVREGRCTSRGSKVLSRNVTKTPPGDDEQVVRMYATNALVEQYNESRLQAHVKRTGEIPLRLLGDVNDRRPSHKIEKKPLTAEWFDQLLATAGFSNNYDVARGCRVMIGRNDPEKTYMNGDSGVLVNILFDTEDGRKGIDDVPSDQLEELVPQSLVVELDRGPTVTVEAHTAEVKDAMGSTQMVVVGLPVKLGWAATVHRVQGTTVNRAWVDMDSICHFPEDARHGLAYVALSRTRESSGLSISRWNPDAVMCDPETKTFL